MRKLFLLFFFPLFGTAKQPVPQIIPEPVELKKLSGSLILNSTTPIVFVSDDSTFKSVLEAFTSSFSEQTGLAATIGRIAVDDTSQASPILVAERKNGLAEEGYEMEITPVLFRIRASKPAGLFYALQSLKQLLPLKRSDYFEIPCLYIKDYPRFSYRGMHLDVSRNFFPVDFIKRYLDLLAFYKINTFHWHLTDSNGWRLESKKFPRLTSVGAWRADRTGIPFVLSQPSGEQEPATYGGFYTQEQVRELISYAKDRFISIIPEIEMPGHCTAALAAYPQYTCLNNPVPLRIPTGYPGDLKHNFCPGNDSTFLFLQEILDEVIELFPSPYIHIGGDEVRPVSWLNCPRCQKRMKENKLSTPGELQAYFTERIDNYISSKNRKLIGWDEIMEAGISPNAAVMSWRGKEGGIAAAKAAHEVVMAPYRYVYFDFYQSAPELEPDISYAGLSIDSVYKFEPVPAGLNTREKAFVLGGQACLWTENIQTTDRVEYMLLPRMLALSEALWTTATQKNYRHFVDKLDMHFAQLRAKSVNYSRSIFNVFIQPNYDSATGKVIVSIYDQTAGKYTIRFSVNGNGDNPASVYTKPFAVSSSSEIKAGLYSGDSLLGKITVAQVSIHQAFASNNNFTHPSVGRLVDGVHGSIEPYDGKWVYWSDSIRSFQLDLGAVKKIRGIRFRCLEDQVGNALLPEKIDIEISKKDEKFISVYSATEKEPRSAMRKIHGYQINTSRKKARYIRFKFKTSSYRHPDYNGKNSVFIDELIVD
ncbi:family 20 glycosylhydrolase [Flavihumibacter sp. UBA7668]|uniref:glycoside hydrolase family 20 protein n=1 Tax=Flavihumibacter sp. UBA7668 TaxID=1946542 RepID=UPI0025BFE18B|nr:family 20 glycosylhydrolase [Flavihumibacter sp. UBA7668]